MVAAVTQLLNWLALVSCKTAFQTPLEDSTATFVIPLGAVSRLLAELSCIAAPMYQLSSVPALYTKPFVTAVKLTEVPVALAPPAAVLRAKMPVSAR